MKSHRLLLALIFAKEINENIFNKEEFDFLLGDVITEESSKIPVPKYLDSKQGEMFRTLVRISGLK